MCNLLVIHKRLEKISNRKPLLSLVNKVKKEKRFDSVGLASICFSLTITNGLESIMLPDFVTEVFSRNPALGNNVDQTLVTF